MLCCVNCFDNHCIKDNINKNGEIDECEVCNSKDVMCIDAEELNDLFAPLLEMYHPLEVGQNTLPDHNDLGDSLAFLIQEDWQIFNDNGFEDNKENRLLDEIRGIGYDELDEQSASDGWVRYNESFSYRSNDQLWANFSNYIKHKNRFFFDTSDFDIFNPSELLAKDAFSFAEAIICKDTVFYRARLGCSKENYGAPEPYKPLAMGVPPIEKAKAGRANPAGIVYLYLATDMITAVAEIRPWKGAPVTVGDGKVKKALKVVDLSEKYFIKCPLSYQSLVSELEKRKLLHTLGNELAKPVDPDKADVDYIPTQYLTEAIRVNGYDGIIFNSAMESGKNIVVFNPDDVEIVNSKLVYVQNITYEV